MIIKKFSNFIFIDKREQENILDWQTISETAQADFQSTDEEGINGTRQLMAEATSINKSFIVGTQSKNAPQTMDQKDPHIEVESQVIPRVGYVYKLWKTKGPRSKRICVRCPIHSYNEASKENMNLFALHEWNSKRQGWAKDLDQQQAVCLTREISDN